MYRLIIVRTAIILLFVTAPCIFNAERLLAQIEGKQVYPVFEKLTAEYGLSQGTLQDILQDKEGFMWFATQDGLDRYDGNSMKVYRYNPDDKFSLPDNDIMQIEQDERGNTWVGTLTKGLFLFDTKQERFYPVNPGTITRQTADEIRMIECRGDKMWLLFGTDYCVYDISNVTIKSAAASGNVSIMPLFSFKSLEKITGKKLTDEFGVFWIKWMPDNSIFMAWKDSVMIMKPQAGSKQWKVAYEKSSAFGMDKNQTIFHFYPVGNGDSIVFIGISTLSVYSRRLNKVIYQKDFGEYNQLADNFYWYYPVFVSNEDIMFFDKLNCLSFNPRTLQFKRYNVSKTDPNGHFTSFANYKDRDGTLWVGDIGHGLYKYNSRRELFGTDKPIADESIFNTDIQGNIYCFDGNESYIINPLDRRRQPAIPQKLLAGKWLQPRVLCSDRNGNIWFRATSKEKFETLTRYYNTATPQPSKWIFYQALALLKYDAHTGKIVDHTALLAKEVFGNARYQLSVFTDAGNNLWQLIYGADKNCRFEVADANTGKPKATYILPLPVQQADRDIFYFTHWQDADGIFWFGTNQGLFRFDERSNQWKLYKNNTADTTSLSGDYIFSICADPQQPDKYLWLGTNGRGFNRFDKQTGKCIRYSDKDGLPNNVVFGILHDNFSNLWMSTNKGISCFNIQQKIFRNFTTEDGLPGNEFIRGQFLKSRSGEMFFGAVNGILWFNPADLLKSVLPANNIFITSLSLLNKQVDYKTDSSVINMPIQYTKAITLPYEKNVIGLGFALLQYTNAEKKHYKYKLEGFNDDWIDNGTSTTVTFTNLDPGTYQFYVTGSNSDGIWNEQGASLTIIITPPWYRTWWFLSIVALLIAGVLYATYRYRLYQSLKLLNMRNKIASDLHDEIGSTLSSITVYSDIIEGRGKDRELEMIAARISESSRNMLVAMSDIVWSINPKNDRFDNIMLRMKSFAYEILETQNRQFHFEADDSLNCIKISMNDRKNFYLIFKEALNNAVKYAEPKNVWIIVRLLNRQIHFTLKDDGIGFNTNEYREGNGLINIKRRAKDLKGTLIINSQPGKGTEVILQFPI